jgi:leucyl aminopeptidase
METMKDDMSGAAAVLGTLKAAADLKLPVNLIGVIPATENGIGPDSYKPGDVYQSHSGKTVEISDTDAEGRLVLADAISYVQKHYTPTQIIDLATLTGGIIVALGEHATGLFSNDDALADRLYEAGEATQERVWRMPLYDDYKDCLKSSIADLKNSAGRSASSISGALFIQEFVKEIPWAHLDIAGTAYLTTPRHYHPTHATGVGVRLLVRFLLDQK